MRRNYGHYGGPCLRRPWPCGLHGNRTGPCPASAIPIVRLFHPEAKVTHEAAIGSVDKQELETLMARGLAPDQAVELIVSGILR